MPLAQHQLPSAPGFVSFVSAARMCPNHNRFAFCVGVSARAERSVRAGSAGARRSRAARYAGAIVNVLCTACGLSLEFPNVGRRRFPDADALAKMELSEMHIVSVALHFVRRGAQFKVSLRLIRLTLCAARIRSTARSAALVRHGSVSNVSYECL